VDKETFFEETDKFYQICRNTLGAKDIEYARNGDKLHNFKHAGLLERTSPERALRGMLTKHIISIYDMIEDLEGGSHHTLEIWDEKLKDAINYLFLLRGLLIEEAAFSGCAENQNLKAPVEEKQKPSPATSADSSDSGTPSHWCPACKVPEGSLHREGCPYKPRFIAYFVEQDMHMEGVEAQREEVARNMAMDMERAFIESSPAREFVWYCQFCRTSTILLTDTGYQVCPNCKAKMNLQACDSCGNEAMGRPRGIMHKQDCPQHAQHPSGGLVEDYEYNNKKVPDVPVNFDPGDVDLF
jgi:hypothetical protein